MAEQTDPQNLAREFFMELNQLHEQGQGPIDEEAVRPLIKQWITMLEWSRFANLPDSDVDAIVQSARDALEAYGNYKRSTGANKGSALTAVGAYLDVFLAILDGSRDYISRKDIDKHRPDIEAATRQAATLRTVLEYVTERTAGVDRALEEAKQAAEDAQNASAQASKAATEAATNRLERSFQETATSNARAAFWFRLLTIVTLGLIVILGGWFAIAHAPTGQAAVDWYGIVYRLAVLSGLGALAAYFGRQASNYRRVAIWAHGIEIQLKAFLGFVREIEDEDAKQTMYTLFGKRVLEAPPDSKTSSDDSVTNVIQPIIEQASKLRGTTT